VAALQPGGDPTERVEGRVEDRWMVCPDGVRLATRLWRPAGEGPWPVLLMRQPYGRAIASTVTYAHPRWYADHGFLVAVQDVRGRGDSEGHFMGFQGEAADGAAAVRWARGLSDANGRVGTYGFSYQGLTQLLNVPPDGDTSTGAASRAAGAAGDSDPFPDCLAPAMAGLDERRHWASEGGAHWWGLGLAWALQLAAEGCRRRGDGAGWREIRRSLTAGTYVEEGVALLERHDPAGMGLAWLRLDAGDPAPWRRHPVAAALLRRPMLLIGGWHDPHLAGVLDLWRRARAAGGQPALVVGPWTHLDWEGGLDALQLAFFRRHLLPGGAADRDTADSTASDVSDPAASLPTALQAALDGDIALAGEGSTGWFTPPEPSPAAATSLWRLWSDGRAAVRADEGRLVDAAAAELEGSAASRPVVLVHDPWRPVPSRGGHLGLPPGLLDRSDLDGRCDVACFTSAAQDEPRLLLGRPRLELVVRADQPGFDLCVALALLPAGGHAALQVSSGVARWLGPAALRRERRRVELQPLALQLRPGDRLRLTIAAAAWPAIAVNPGDGSRPWGGPGPGHRVISLALEPHTALIRLDPWLAEPAGAD
jgi:predicted acyl esterase